MELLKGSELRKAPALLTTIRQDGKGLARDEHSRLLRFSINYGRKKFYNIDITTRCFNRVECLLD